MEVHFIPELEERLARTAERQGGKPDEFLQDVLIQYFEDESRFEEEVRHGQDALDRGDYLTHEHVGERLRRFLQQQMEVRWSVQAAVGRLLAVSTLKY